jgi:hypothetical protein
MRFCRKSIWFPSRDAQNPEPGSINAGSKLMSQSATIHSASGAKSDIEAATIRAISWRLIPFLVLTYFFSYLDRVNLGFAVLTTNAELKFTPLIFSWGARRSFSSAISCSRCRATWRWKKFGASAGSRASW